MSELKEYEAITKEAVIVNMTKLRGKLVVTETQEYLEVECRGTIEANGEEAPLYEFIDNLAEGEKVTLTLAFLPKLKHRVSSEMSE